MKTFAALIRRYVLATAAIVLLVGGLLVGQIFFMWGSNPTRWMQQATGSAPWLMP